jgi:hypothetical protein
MSVCPDCGLRDPLHVGALITELETTRAQVAGMRTALEKIAANTEDSPYSAWLARYNAKAALSPTPAEKATTPGRSAT